MTGKDLPQPQLPEDSGGKMDKVTKALKEATVARSKTIFDVIWRRVREQGIDKRFPDRVENMDASDRRWFEMFRPYILKDMAQPIGGSEALQVGFVTAILDRERKYLEEEIKAGNRRRFPRDARLVYEREWAPVQETFMMQVFEGLPEYERGQALELADHVRRVINYRIPFCDDAQDALLFYSAFKAGEIPPFRKTMDDAAGKAA